MYNLSDEQEKDIQSWIKKLPDSIVKSQIINLFEEVYPTNRVTVEQLEKFLSFQNALPKEFQPYPQIVAQWLRNGEATKKAEDKLDIAKGSEADFAGIVADSHAHIKSPKKAAGAKGEQVQEVLHTLNVTDKAKAGTKADPHTSEDNPTYTEELQTEAAESAKTSGGKPEAQKKEEESIIARNQDAGDDKVKTEKPNVVVEKKSGKK